jgi:hypothetical protein
MIDLCVYEEGDDGKGTKEMIHSIRIPPTGL